MKNGCTRELFKDFSQCRTFQTNFSYPRPASDESLETRGNLRKYYVKLQIKGIKEDVEYYIDSSLEPGFEENDYIYDDIQGLDEIELSGVGPSTDSNNSNGSAATPNSILSGEFRHFSLSDAK